MLNIDVKRIRYSVAALGKFGASMAAAIAGRGFDVIGVDVNSSVIQAVNAGRATGERDGPSRCNQKKIALGLAPLPTMPRR
jgi:UDP-N-acetyl-D-mannosaminuronate dehydrogenase